MNCVRLYTHECLNCIARVRNNDRRQRAAPRFNAPTQSQVSRVVILNCKRCGIVQIIGIVDGTVKR